MKRLLLLTTSALPFLLTTAGPASAGPFLGAIPAIFGAVISGASIAQVVLGVALSVGTTLLQMALNPEQKQQPVGVQLQVTVGDDQPVSTCIGLYATSGKRSYIGSYGELDGTPNAMLVDVYALGNLPASGRPVGLWIDSEKVTPLWDEEPSIRGYPIKEFRKTKDGTNTDYAWIRYFDGTQTQADQYLISKFGDDEKRPYTADMIGRGVPYAVMTFRYNRKFFRGQPKVLFEMPALALYDIRKDSTNGGNGTHRWGVPSTYEPSYNLAVMAYNVGRGLSYKGEWFYGGQDVAAHRLPSASWIAAAQECSRIIEVTGQDPEPQFRGGLEITGDVQPLEVLEEFRKAMNGRLIDSAGTLKAKVGAFGAAVFAFTDDDVIITESQGFDPFPPLDQTVNAINASYPEPKNKWAAKDAPPLRDAALEAIDGKRLPLDLQFRATSFNRQVQRIIRAVLKEERRFLTHQIWLPPRAYILEPGIDVISWTSVHNGYSAKKFNIVEIEGDPGFNQLLTIREIDPSDHDWSPDFEMPFSTGWVGRIDAPVQQMTGWTAEPSSIVDASGTERRPAIRVKCGADLDDVSKVQVKVRLAAQPDKIVFDSDQTTYDEPYQWDISGNWMLPLTDYEVSGTYIPYSTRDVAWSAWLPVTTKDLLITSEDIFDNAIIQQKIADAAVSASKIMDEAVTNLKLANEAVSTAKLQVAAVTAQVLANQAVIASKLADGAVERDKLAAQAVDATKFASGIEPVSVVAGVTVPTTKTTEVITVNGKLYRWSGSAYTAAVPAVDVSGQLSAAQIADAAITTSKLGPLAVDASKIAANAITETKISDGAISTPKIQANAITADLIAANAITAKQLVITDYQNLLPNGNFAQGMDGWGRVSGDVSTITNATGPSKTAVKIVHTTGEASTTAWDGWGASKSPGIAPLIEAGTEIYIEAWVYSTVAGTGLFVDLPGFRPSDGTTYNPGGITATVAANTWTKISGVIKPGSTFYMHPRIQTTIDNSTAYVCAVRVLRRNAGSLIVDGSIVAGMIAANAVTAEKISAGAVTADAIAANAITAAKIAAGAVNTAQLAAGAVTATIIASDAITTAKIAAGAVTATEIAANAVIAGKIAADAVTASTIATGAVTADAIAANAVTAVKIAAGTITGDKIAANTIGASQIAANAITAKQLVLTDFSNMVDNGWQTGDQGGWAFNNQLNWLYSDAKGDASGWLFISNARDCARSNDIQVTPGETYYFDVWVYNYDDAAAQILVGRRTIRGGTVSYTAVAATNTKTAWTRLRGQYTVEAGVYFLCMLLQVNKTTSGTGGSTEWSKPVMRRAYAAELIVDGGITAAKIAANSINAGMIQTGAITTDKLILGGVTYDKLAQNSSAQVWQTADASQVSLGTTFQSVAQVSASKTSADALIVIADIRAQTSNLGTTVDGAGTTVNAQVATLQVELWDGNNNQLTQATLMVSQTGITSCATLYYASTTNGSQTFKLVVKSQNSAIRTNWTIGRRTITAMALNKAT